MSNFNLSANMSMPIPVAGIDPGPDYALNVDNCLVILDSHDHSAGKGVPITPSSLNINADLPVNGNNLTLARTVRFSVQASVAAVAPDLGCLFVVGADLYYNDINGNQVRITQGGAVTGATGTITGLPSGTASASYSAIAGKFVFQSASNTGADIDGASLLIREKAANAKAITLASPSALAADYTLTLPAALPGSQKFLSLDSGGNVAATWSVDNSTLQISSNLVQIKDAGVTAAKLAANVKPAMIALGTQSVSNDYTVLSTDQLIYCNAPGLVGFTVTLPAASTINHTIYIQKTDGNWTNPIVITDGSFSTTLNTTNESVTLTSDGSAYRVQQRNSGTAQATTATVITGAVSNPTKGAGATDHLTTWREGQFLCGFFQYIQSAAGTAGSGAYRIDVMIGNSLGLTIDTSKTGTYTGTSGNLGPSQANVGVLNLSNGATLATANLCVYDSSNIQALGVDGGTTAFVWGSGTKGFNVTTLTFSGWFKVPIVGWNA